MTDCTFRMSHAALVAALFATPVFAASDPAIEQQLNALQQALAKQQEQLAQQQQEIERLRQQLAAQSSGGAATVEQIVSDVQQAKLAAQDQPESLTADYTDYADFFLKVS